MTKEQTQALGLLNYIAEKMSIVDDSNTKAMNGESSMAWGYICEKIGCIDNVMELYGFKTFKQLSKTLKTMKYDDYVKFMSKE